MRVPHRATCERACRTVPRDRARPGRSTPEAEGWQEPNWCDVVDELVPKWARREPVSSATRISRVTVVRERAQFCWTSSVADAVSLIRTSSQKQILNVFPCVSLVHSCSTHVSVVSLVYSWSTHVLSVAVPSTPRLCSLKMQGGLCFFFS